MDKTQVQNVITTKTTDDKLSVAVKKTNSIEDQDLSQFITVQSPISPKEEAQEEDESTEEETTEEEEEQSPSKGGFLKFGIKKGKSPPPGSTHSSGTKVTGSSTNIFGNLGTDIIKMLNLRSSNSDVSKQPVSVSPKVPPKSILKKKPSELTVDGQPSDKTSSPVLIVSSVTGSHEMVGEKDIAQKDESTNETSHLSTRLGGNSILSNSLPDLQPQTDSKSETNSLHNSLHVKHSHSMATLKKSGSSKSLTFNLENVTVFNVPAKNVYNREPDKNATYRKLTPKLKDEIRAELNQYKSTEMEIHEASASNTAFH